LANLGSLLNFMRYVDFLQRLKSVRKLSMRYSLLNQRQSLRKLVSQIQIGVSVGPIGIKAKEVHERE